MSGTGPGDEKGNRTGARALFQRASVVRGLIIAGAGLSSLLA
ncbi:hypothetical protein FTUN_3865 [Frigoriglobus tundricola]|uniref:Uncharacterized protein n=1 Tax=Frigoriglobus tundricola TaxID=2774151 RepID=A0A6M5YQU1_9BACT|nr:hypothetical protein FTUN_3865 [Frigoriglobus tundricola]